MESAQAGQALMNSRGWMMVVVGGIISMQSGIHWPTLPLLRKLCQPTMALQLGVDQDSSSKWVWAVYSRHNSSGCSKGQG